jgi:hypothetical protein
MNSKSPKLDAMQINDLQQEYIDAEIKRLEIWTINKFNNLILVLKSSKLTELSKQYHYDYDVDKKDDFIPHITLSYNVGNYTIPEIELNWNIVFDCIRARPI